MINKDSSLIDTSIKRVKDKRKSHGNHWAMEQGNIVAAPPAINNKDYWKVYKVPVMGPLASTNLHANKTDLAQPVKRPRRKNLAKILKEKSEMLASQ